MYYDISQQFLHKNRSNISFKPIGIVLHSTDTLNATAQNEHDYFNNNNVAANAHGFIDDTEIIQTIPWFEKGWHACEPANSMFIGIELCEFNDVNRFKQIWNRATWLFAYIFVNILNINTVTQDNLMSHAEVSSKWKTSNHQDPINYLGKFGKTVEQFRNEVQQEINNMISALKEENKVKNLIIYGNSIDKRAAEYLADYLQCPTMDAGIFYDYSDIENIYCVGGTPLNGWTNYAKKVITGIDRYDTIIQVLKFIGKI